MTVCQKVPKPYFQSQFWMWKNLFKNINLWDHYLLKTFFSSLNFWTTLLSKITPVISCRNFLKIFPWWHVDSWPKSLLLRIHHLWNSTTELILISPKPTKYCCLSFPYHYSLHIYFHYKSWIWKMKYSFNKNMIMTSNSMWSI